MESIKIQVTGNIAKITEKPSIITAGTVGLPVEFTFDDHWNNLSKTAVFRVGCYGRVVENLETETTVPWEVLRCPGLMLNIGVYGVNADGSVATPTIWANVGVIRDGADVECDPSMEPSLPVWQKILDEIGDPSQLETNEKVNLVLAINELFNKIGFAQTGIIVSKEKPTNTPVLWFNEGNNQLTYVDEAGGTILLNPATKISCVDGLNSSLDSKAPVSHISNTSNPHKVTAAQAGAVPTSRTVNGKALSSNITLGAGDVGAVPTSRTVNGKALSSNVTLSASDVGAAPSSHSHSSYFKSYSSVNEVDPSNTSGSFAVGRTSSDAPISTQMVSVSQFKGENLAGQLAIAVNPSTDKNRSTTAWIRDKHTTGSNAWSSWSEILVHNRDQTITGKKTFNSSNTFNGEQNFKNVSYCPTIADTAGGVGCAFKASRGLFNEALLDKIIMTATTKKIPFLKYTGATSSGAMSGLAEVAAINSDGKFVCGDIAAANITASSVSTGNHNFTNQFMLTNSAINMGIKFYAACICPSNEESVGIQLGQSDRRFGTIYSTSELNIPSDRNIKEDIHPIDERFVNLFDKLEPISYKLIGDNHDRDHLGFISQDVKAAMDEAGISDMEFGGFCRDVKTRELIDEETGEVITEPVLDENGDPVYEYSLRYGEFIALNSKIIQLCRETIKEQQEKINDLETRLAKLEAKG